MSKKITSVTMFRDADGIRVSATYTEIDEVGKPIKENVRFNYIADDDDPTVSACLSAMKEDALDHLGRMGD